MKKLLVIVPMFAAAILLSGCGKSAEAPAAKDAGVVKQDAGSSIVGSLKDAIGLGKKMACTSKDANGETTAYIDGQKYKAVSATKEGNMIMIFNGTDFYTWNEKTKQGFVMTKACTDELNKNLPKTDANSAVPENDFQSTDKVVADESMNNCKETGAIDFTIPTDVKFIDQCEMMKAIPANLKDLKIPGQ